MTPTDCYTYHAPSFMASIPSSHSHQSPAAWKRTRSHSKNYVKEMGYGICAKKSSDGFLTVSTAALPCPLTNTTTHKKSCTLFADRRKPIERTLNDSSEENLDTRALACLLATAYLDHLMLHYAPQSSGCQSIQTQHCVPPSAILASFSAS